MAIDMSDLIGELRTARIACEGERHLPSVWNPWMAETFCVCGRQRWPRPVGAWRESPLYRDASRTEVIGWDVYFLHERNCPNEAAFSCDPHC